MTQNARAVPIDARLAEIAEATEPRTAIFGTRRGRAWDPAAIAPIVSPAERKAGRVAAFGAMRDEGLSIAEAARRLAVCYKTAYGYELARRAEAAGAGGAGGAR